MRIKVDLESPRLLQFTCGEYSRKFVNESPDSNQSISYCYPALEGNHIEENIKHIDLLFLIICIQDDTELETAISILNVAMQIDTKVLPIVQMPYPDDYIYQQKAAINLDKLKEHTDNTMIVFPPKDKYYYEQNLMVRRFPIPSIVKTIYQSFKGPCETTLSFKEVQQALLVPGNIYVGTGEAIGDDSAIVATTKAIQHLKSQCPSALKSATSILINITGNIDMSDTDVYDALDLAKDILPEKAMLKSCAVRDFSFRKIMRVTIFCAGCGEEHISSWINPLRHNTKSVLT